MNILMVCLGNICRSPLAQGILENKINQLEIDWRVDSAGTSGWHSGEKPDSRSIQIAQKYGIDISTQRARKLRSIDYEEFDLILAMDESNLADILSLAKPEEVSKIMKITEFSQKHYLKDIPDPYYDSINGFETVFKMLTEAIDGLISKYN